MTGIPVKKLAVRLARLDKIRASDCCTWGPDGSASHLPSIWVVHQISASSISTDGFFQRNVRVQKNLRTWKWWFSALNIRSVWPDDWDENLPKFSPNRSSIIPAVPRQKLGKFSLLRQASVSCIASAGMSVTKFFTAQPKHSCPKSLELINTFRGDDGPRQG